jgi:hypothetical protein
MNILTNELINKEDKSRAFIGVSKKCCYLCGLYIRFAITKGYVINTSGTHRKLYHLWKFPDTDNAIFNDESLSYMIKNLNRVIRDETMHYTEEKASSDSSGGSLDSSSHNVNQKVRSRFRSYNNYNM